MKDRIPTPAADVGLRRTGLPYVAGTAPTGPSTTGGGEEARALSAEARVLSAAEGLGERVWERRVEKVRLLATPGALRGGAPVPTSKGTPSSSSSSSS